MKRATVRFSPRAERWFLEKIAEIAEVSPSGARNITKKLRHQTELLASFPRMTERGLIPGTRKVSLPPFVLTARIRGDLVEIISIRYARQQDAGAPSDVDAEDDEQDEQGPSEETLKPGS